MRSLTSTLRCGLQLDEQSFGEVQISDNCEFVASASFGLRALSSKRCRKLENGEDSVSLIPPFVKGLLSSSRCIFDDEQSFGEVQISGSLYVSSSHGNRVPLQQPVCLQRAKFRRGSDLLQVRVLCQRQLQAARLILKEMPKLENSEDSVALIPPFVKRFLSSSLSVFDVAQKYVREMPGSYHEKMFFTIRLSPRSRFTSTSSSRRS